MMGPPTLKIGPMFVSQVVCFSEFLLTGNRPVPCKNTDVPPKIISSPLSIPGDAKSIIPPNLVLIGNRRFANSINTAFEAAKTP